MSAVPAVRPRFRDAASVLARVAIRKRSAGASSASRGVPLPPSSSAKASMMARSCVRRGLRVSEVDILRSDGPYGSYGS